MMLRLLHISVVILLGISPLAEAFARAAPLTDRAKPVDNIPRAIPLQTPLQEPPLQLPTPRSELGNTPKSPIEASPAPLLTESYLKEIEAEEARARIVPMITLHTSAYRKNGLRIAMLLPLSGDDEARGNALLGGALMALVEAKSDNILLPIDTKSTPEGAVEALAQTIDAQADIILGPITDKAIKAIAEPARKLTIPVIAFSSNPKVATEQILAFGISQEEQARRVVNYAARHGVISFSALLPETSPLSAQKLFGKKPTTTVERYSDAAASRDTAITTLTTWPEGTPPPEDFAEGLFLTEKGESATAFAKKILAVPSAEKRFQLLGLSNWNDPTLLKEKAMNGAWFAVSPPELRYQFELRYTDNFAVEPLRIASLGYDAIALIASLSGTEKPLTRADILSPTGFAGINGSFRFTEKGTTERLLGIAQITPEGFVIIDPVPTVFLRK